MTFAVRVDGQGWRAVNGEGDLWPGEVLSSVEPEETIPLPPSMDDLAAQARNNRDQLLAIAALRVAPLQDAVDADMATDEETASLLKWKRYRVDLNRIEEQETFPLDIQWPVPPDEDVNQI